MASKELRQAARQLSRETGKPLAACLQIVINSMKGNDGEIPESLKYNHQSKEEYEQRAG